MLNALPLMNAVSPTLQLGLFLMLNFLAGLYLFRKKLALSNARSTGRPSDELTMSVFSRIDHPALFRDEGDVNPLTEAEIYLIYGRRKDAQMVLDTAVREGRLSPTDAASFWTAQKRS